MWKLLQAQRQMHRCFHGSVIASNDRALPGPIPDSLPSNTVRPEYKAVMALRMHQHI